LIFKEKTMSLVESKCEPCRGDTPPLTGEEACMLAAETPGWDIGKKSMEREFVFGNFGEAISFVNKVAEIAESEDHHPDILLHSYKKVKIDLTTHKIDGLSKNDFILAAKINGLMS